MCAYFCLYKVGRIDVICTLLGEVCMMQIFAIYRQKNEVFGVCWKILVVGVG